MIRNPAMLTKVFLAALVVVLAAAGVHGQNWIQRTPATNPPPRNDFALAYDEARQRAVLYGGWNGRSNLDDTWEWDGHTWTQLSPSVRPSGRYGHAMIYDPVRQRVVLFGGGGYMTFLNDTWEWDGSTWTQRSVAKSPKARLLHGFAYDSMRRNAMLFGGVSQNNTYPTATWLWDGNVWTLRTPLPSPPSRRDFTMVYDGVSRHTVLFGGYTGIMFGDTWEWDGQAWTQRTPAASPSARLRHAMAYDPVRLRAVMFGGWDASTHLNDTWEWDGNTWTQNTPATNPPGRSHHSMVFDTARQRILLFSGLNLNDTWEYGFPCSLQIQGMPLPGGRVDFTLNAPDDAGRPYQMGSSLGTGPIAIDTRRLNLDPDSMLLVSVSNFFPWIFQGYSGIIDAKGKAAASIHIPGNTALIGTRIHTAFVTLDPHAQSGILSISNTQTFSISH